LVQRDKQLYNRKSRVLLKGFIYMLSPYLKIKYARESLKITPSYLGYNLSWLRTIAHNLNGIQPGLYIIAAETNVGKTTFMTNLFIDLLNSNHELQGIYFSFDDNKDVIINRCLAFLTGIDINHIQTPNMLTESMHKILTTVGYGRLTEWADSGRLNIQDMNDIQSFDALHEIIKKMDTSKSVVCIDGVYNLCFYDNSLGIREENILRANKLKWLVDTYKIPLFATAEVRKKDVKSSLPTHHDIMESSKFAYNAHVIFMLYPGTNSPSECVSKLMLQYEKNKLSAFKGTVPLYFLKNVARLVEEQDWPAAQKFIQALGG
jgi:replicative DNA helicase